MAATNVSGMPDFYERKGSLFLRSDHMNYGRATLNSNWHQAREAEPKDYDLSQNEERDLGKATYKRVGNVTDGSLPHTTYQDFAAQSKLKSQFTEKEVRKPMVNLDTLEHVAIERRPKKSLWKKKKLLKLSNFIFYHNDFYPSLPERDTGMPSHGFGSVLPRHNPDHNKHYLESTHRCDFTPPDPEYEPVPERPPDFADLSAAYRKCHSQFTDAADYRRPGRNTWQDESGIYTNSHYKRQVFQPTQTIPPQLN